MPVCFLLFEHPARNKIGVRNDLTRLLVECHDDDEKTVSRQMPPVAQDDVVDVTDALAARSVNIEELVTETVEAPMDGGTLFKARASLVLPESVSSDDLTEVLEELAAQLMVDIEIDEVG